MSDWQQYLDQPNDRFIEWLSVVVGAVIVIALGFMLYFTFMGVVALSFKGVKPQEPSMPVIERTTLQTAPLCLQSCDTLYAVQSATTSQYLNGVR